MQLTTVSVAIHGRDTMPDEPGVIVLSLRNGPTGFVFEVREVGADDPGALTLTEEELAALPAARAHLLDQFTRDN